MRTLSRSTWQTRVMGRTARKSRSRRPASWLLASVTIIHFPCVLVNAARTSCEGVKWVMAHTWERTTCEEFIYLWMLLALVGMSHIPCDSFMCGSCHIHKCKTPSHVVCSHVWAICHAIWLLDMWFVPHSHVWAISHVHVVRTTCEGVTLKYVWLTFHVNESRTTYVWTMSHLNVCELHVNASRCTTTYECVTNYICLCQLHMNVSRSTTYESVTNYECQLHRNVQRSTSYIWMCHELQVIVSTTYECVSINDI